MPLGRLLPGVVDRQAMSTRNGLDFSVPRKSKPYIQISVA